MTYELPDWAQVLDFTADERRQIDDGIALAVARRPAWKVHHQCAECGADWFGLADEDCTLCQWRTVRMMEGQVRLDRERFADLCQQIADGDVRAVAKAVELARVSASSGRMDAAACARQLGRAARRGAA